MIYNDSKYNQDWEIKTLSQLGDFKRGKSKHRPRNDKQLFINGKYPLVQTGEISAANLYIRNHSAMYNEFGLAQSRLWPINTLCITIAANIAETALLGYPMCFPDSVAGFNAHPSESSELFMHYVFTYIKKSIQNAATGSIQDNINIEYLSSLKLRIPKKKYQDQLTEILSILDLKIELNRKMISELEAIAKTLFDYWFVQFDFPNDKGKPYRTSGGSMVWSEELKREIPKGYDWCVGTLLDVANYTNGLPCQKFKPTNEDSLRVIKIKEMNDGYSLNSERVRLDIPEKAIVEDGDVLFSWSASLDVKIWSGGRGALNQHIFKVTSEKHPKSFYYYHLLNYLHHFKMMAENRKTTMGHITQEHLLQSRIIIPPKGLIISLDKKIAPLLELKIMNEIEIQKISELRDWLLPMLMSGQVRIK